MSGPVARVDLAALRHNLVRVRRAATHSRIMAVVKANAYGHGASEVARALADADAFAVARVEEGLALRRAGVAGRIVLLQGLSAAPELPLALSAGLEPVVHHAGQIEILRKGLGRAARGLRCWIKVDSGMSRLGFRPAEVAEAAAALRAVPGVVVYGVMTHLANNDLRADPITREQLARFGPAVEGLGLPRSIGNSAGIILGWPEAQGEWVRPGIMLYGASPFPDSTAAAEGLRPVMTLRTRLIAVRSGRKGETVGYGATWPCPEDMPVGVAAVGYGDGYPRHAPSGTPVLIGGHRVPVIGRGSAGGGDRERGGNHRVRTVVPADEPGQVPLRRRRD